MEATPQLLSSRLAPDDVSPGAGLGIPELTRRLAAGDEAAYRVFYDAYFDRLWRYLLVVTGGDEDAVREALQSAMVRVVRHVKVFPDDAVFWGWLTVLARSALADQNRKRHRYLAFLDRFTLHAEIQKATGEPREPGPDLLARLEGNLSTLPADERQLLEWKYNGRRPVRAIAAELGVSEKAVESRLSRIRRKLKEALLKGANDE